MVVLPRVGVPRLPRGTVRRRGVESRLDDGAGRELTVVSAPAGFGKTTAVAAWVRARPGPATAWVRAGGPDEASFAAAVLAAVAALATVPPDAPLRRLAASPPGAPDDLEADLVEALVALPDRVRLVVDDAGGLADPGARRVLEALVRARRPTGGVQLVLATRRRPELPLGRWRPEGRLAELDARHLAFGAAETAVLTGRLGVRLGPRHVALLHERTGGWAVGLRLAVRALAGHPDPARVLEELPGDRGPVADHLAAEVLADLPDRERETLRRVSVVPRVPAGLAAALTGDADAPRVLDRLARSTGLVRGTGDPAAPFRVPELLRAHLAAGLARRDPELADDLRRRAARWGATPGRAAPGTVRPVARTGRAPGASEVRRLALLAVARWVADDLPGAAGAADRALALAPTAGRTGARWAAVAAAVRAHGALLRAQPAAALDTVAAHLGAADPATRWALRAARGAALVDLGDLPGGLRELRAARGGPSGPSGPSGPDAARVPTVVAVTALLLEHAAALRSGERTSVAAAVLTSRYPTRPETALARAWTRAAAGDHDGAHRVVAALLGRGGVPLVPRIEAELVVCGSRLVAGDRGRAREALRRALVVAGPPDVRRPFARDGVPHVLLVDELLPGAPARDLLTGVLAGRAAGSPTPITLSRREHDVLRRLPSLEGVDDIADELGVSANTVKTHVRGVYTKLGVRTRRAAVLAGHQQGLLP